MLFMMFLLLGAYGAVGSLFFLFLAFERLERENDTRASIAVEGMEPDLSSGLEPTDSSASLPEAPARRAGAAFALFALASLFWPVSIVVLTVYRWLEPALPANLLQAGPMGPRSLASRKG